MSYLVRTFQSLAELPTWAVWAFPTAYLASLVTAILAGLRHR